MGYLNKVSGLSSFSKATISLWFKLPAATYNAVYGLSPEITIDGVSDAWNELNGFNGPFYKCIPLISFGSIESANSYGGGVTCQPSFIGIDFSGIQANSPFNFYAGKTGGTLACNLQTSNNLSFSKTPSDPSNILRPQCYYMRGVGQNPNTLANSQIVAVPDTWHHALISFDLSPSFDFLYKANVASLFSITPGPRFSWSFDDHDRTEDYTTRPSVANVAALSNGLTAVDMSYLMPSGPPFANTNDQFLPVGAETDFDISLATGVISAGAVGIPTNISGSVYNIEMGELQFYTDLFIDTRMTANRRLFVTDAGKPANAALAMAGLGKTPEIYLGGTSKNWIAGKNSGTAGNFTPTGTIKPYTPGPSLS